MNKPEASHKIMRKRVVYNIIVFCLLVVLAAAVFMPLPKRLCIWESGNSAVVEVFAANTDDFVISYTHSVNRGRVRDFYTLATDGGICLTHTVFVSYGAGMPEPSGEQVFEITDEGIEISNINLELEELILQTGVIADHHVETADKTVVLNEKIPMQTRIIIGVRRISGYEIIKDSLRNQIQKGRSGDS